MAWDEDDLTVGEWNRLFINYQYDVLELCDDWLDLLY